MIPLNSPMKLTVQFVDDILNPFDPPSNVKIKVKDPRGGIQTLNYPADLTKDSVGTYHGTVEATIEGRWVGRGSGQLANGQVINTPDVVETVGSTEVPG